MKLITKSEKHNPNYLCKIIRVKNLRKHPNADKLSIFTVDGNDIVTSNSTPEDQISIYFPLEVQINHDYLRAGNDYRKNLGLNNDPESPGGFFEDKGRVKAVKLRGQKSEGYVVPISSLACIIGDKYKELEQYIGEEFDTLNGTLLAEKYIPPTSKTGGKESTKGDRPKRKFESKLLDNQFRLHYDTAQLGKNIHRLQRNDLISISWKFHGTSFVSSKILCKRELKWYERIAKAIGLRIVDTEYSNIYSSRKVIKNEDINKQPQHYYKYDLWSDINDRFKNDLIDGETIYGEAVGYTKDGGYIQAGFDYGCEPKKFDIYIYRITQTNQQGKVIDLPFNFVQERAQQLGAKTVPLIYFGRADGFYKDCMTDEVWRESFFNKLKADYVYDQDSQFCKNKVPEEGIVLRIEGLKPEALKLKAFRFLESESKALDKGEVNIEDGESVS
jgi:hypothetical protein